MLPCIASEGVEVEYRCLNLDKYFESADSGDDESSHGSVAEGMCRNCRLMVIVLDTREKVVYKCMWCDEETVGHTQLVDDDTSSEHTFGRGELSYMARCRKKGSLGNTVVQKDEGGLREQRVNSEEERCGMWWKCPVRNCRLENRVLFIFDVEKERYLRPLAFFFPLLLLSFFTKRPLALLLFLRPLASLPLFFVVLVFHPPPTARPHCCHPPFLHTQTC